MGERNEENERGQTNENFDDSVSQTDCIDIQAKDGFILDVDAEELDYVDDLDDDLMVDCAKNVVVETTVPEVVHEVSTDKGAAPKISDEELMKDSTVKEMFNQFWEEKMKEIMAKDSSKLEGQKKGFEGCFSSAN